MWDFIQACAWFLFCIVVMAELGDIAKYLRLIHKELKEKNR